MTVKEVSDLTSVSVRSLHHYDHVGLLKPASWTKSGYRIYGEKELVRLQQILFFKELGFSLKEIRTILDAPGFDWKKALEQQIELLTMKKEHIENMILFARGMKGIGLKYMDFKAFDTRKMDEYAKKAKETWGNTKEYREMEEKNLTKEQEQIAGTQMMALFAEFGEMKQEDPASEKVQAQVKKLQEFITEHFYTCSNSILRGLGMMYGSDGEIAENIDKVGGAGTGAFVHQAIEIYAGK